MQNTSPRMVGRRALIKGTAMLAVAATARAQGPRDWRLGADVAHHFERFTEASALMRSVTE